MISRRAYYTDLVDQVRKTEAENARAYELLVEVRDELLALVENGGCNISRLLGPISRYLEDE